MNPGGLTLEFARLIPRLKCPLSVRALVRVSAFFQLPREGELPVHSPYYDNDSFFAILKVMYSATVIPHLPRTYLTLI